MPMSMLTILYGPFETPVFFMAEVPSGQVFKELGSQDRLGPTGVDANGCCEGFELRTLACAEP